MVCHVSSILTHPRNQTAAENLKNQNIQIQQQFLNHKSDFMEMLGKNETITQLLDKNEQSILNNYLKFKGQTTIENDVAVLIMFSARDSNMRGFFDTYEIDHIMADSLAKTNSILNFADADNKQELNNSDVGKALIESDNFTRSFFRSETFKSCKQSDSTAPNAAIAARWITNRIQQQP